MYADRDRLARLFEEELARYAEARPESKRLWEAGREHLPDGVK